jgi:hypothetical protein
MWGTVVVTPPNTNRLEWAEFPPVAIRKYRMLDGSCRAAILDILADTDAATGKPMTGPDVHAMLQATTRSTPEYRLQGAAPDGRRRHCYLE